jgi:hypothetical protein
MSSIDSLIRQVNSMPNGSTRAEAGRKLWHVAQNSTNHVERFNALSATLQAVLFGGATDYFLALFPQYAGFRREHPEAVNLHDYVWRLKWLTANLLNYPEIPLDRIIQAEKHYEESLREAGGDRRTAIYLAWQNAFDTGRLELARELYPRFIHRNRDENSDCHACEIHALVRGALMVDKDPNAAIEAAKPLTDGRMRCATKPHATYGQVILPVLLSGDSSEASIHHRKGYSLIRSNTYFLGTAGSHLAYLAASGNADRFWRLFNVHLSWLDQNREPSSTLDFFQGAAAGCRLLAETGHRKRPVKPKLPAPWSQTWGAKPMSILDFTENLEHEAHTLAAAFDRRNGNTWRSDLMKDTWDKVRQHWQNLDPATESDASSVDE